MKRILGILSFFICFNISAQDIQYVNMNASSKWKQGYSGITKIKVFWQNPSADNYQERKWVEEAISDTWEKYANIDFYGWGKYDNSQSGIIISINDYLVPRSLVGSSIKGVEKFYDSKERIWLNGGMILNFNFLGHFKGYNGFTKEENIKSIAVHEFGHALGISHEQDRDNCGCDLYPDYNDMLNRGGDYYGTPCDINSVMNYCNPIPNNRGVLSQYDIKGIQAIYGKRELSSNDNQISSSNKISITNELGSNQVWENLYLTIGSAQLVFNINKENNEEIKQVLVKESGYYSYSVISNTMLTNNALNYGTGKGQIYLDKDKSYRLALYMENLRDDSYEIVLKAVDIENEHLSYYQDDSNSNADVPLSNDKPIGLLKINNITHEKFYVYADGTIKVYNMNSKEFFTCGKKEAPIYKSWNGRTWAWVFKRPIANSMVETYSVSTTGEVWALTKDGGFEQFGYVTHSDF